jgi:hypothetical protein
LQPDKSLFPTNIRSLVKPSEIGTIHFNHWSLRQASATQATNMNVLERYTNVINRSTRVERAGAKQASLPMNKHYAQIEELLPLFKHTPQQDVKWAGHNQPASKIRALLVKGGWYSPRGKSLTGGWVDKSRKASQTWAFSLEQMTVHGGRSWLDLVLELMSNVSFFLTLDSKSLLRNAKDKVFSLGAQGDSPVDFTGLWRNAWWDDAAPWSKL